MASQSLIHGKISTWLGAALVLIGIYLTSLYSYLLFHSLVEMFSVAIAGGIFMIAWNPRRFNVNNYLFLISIIYCIPGSTHYVDDQKEFPLT